MSERTPELADLIVGAINDRLADVHTMLPGRIESYDKATQKAEVQPLLRRVQKTVDGEINEVLPIIPGVPVVFPRAGGFKITFPVAAGDRCTLIFCESSIDAYQVGQGGVTDPGLFQSHDLSDPVALLGWYPDQDALSATDDSDMVLGKEGGAVIHIADDLVYLYSRTGGDFVALAQKVLDELNLVKADIESLSGVYDSHTHLLPTSVPTVPPGTAPTPPPLPSSSAPHTPQSVAAEKVKAT